MEELPMILTAKEVAAVLQISKNRAYEIMEFEDFPLIRIGKSKRVAKEAFLNWLKNYERVS